MNTRWVPTKATDSENDSMISMSFPVLGSNMKAEQGKPSRKL
jgi:hypothetical protein